MSGSQNLRGRSVVLALAAAMLAPNASGQAPVIKAPAMRWYRGNTHTHTINSDGDSAPDVVVRWYREHHYQFLFITDHEYVTDVAPLNALLGATGKFLVLPGQEVTQWSDDPKRSSSRVSALIGVGAHVNALFAKQVVWPVGERTCLGPGCGATAPPSVPVRETFKANIAAIRAEGGIAQINHPNLLWSVRPDDLTDTPDGTLIEIWNGAGSIINNLGGGDGAGDVRPSAEGFWDWLLSLGKIVWGVGADDSHAFQTSAMKDPAKSIPGRAWIVVRAAELTPTDLRAAITSGNFYASTGVALDEIASDGSQLTLTIKPEPMVVANMAPPRYTTRFVGQNSETLATAGGVKPVYRFKGSEAYVRAVVTDSNGKTAWTQPVFVDGRRGQSPYGRR